MKTYTDVASLSKTQLKNICKEHAVTTDHGKAALTVIVCQLLGISTTGRQENCIPRRKSHYLDEDKLTEYSKITLAFVQRIPGDTKLLDK